MKPLPYLIALLISSISLSAQNTNTCSAAHLADSVFVAKLCSSAQTVIYVKSDGVSNGTSWDQACSLDSAMRLAAQTSGAHVLVEAGVYYLSRASLDVPPSTVLHGGFSEDHDNLSGWHRHYGNHATILDGRRSCGVVRLSAHAELDGFTIQNGLAAAPQQSDGGGIYMEAGAIVRNCYVSNNIALNYGGGIYAESDGLVVNTVINGNRAGVNGFAAYGTTCTFRNNTVADNAKIEHESITEKKAESDSTVLKPTICSGEVAKLIVLDKGAYLWNTGATTSGFTTPELFSTTTYTCTVTSPSKDTVYVLSFIVHVKPLPVLTVTTDKTTANVGDSVVFTAIGTPTGGYYRWNDAAKSRDSVIVQTMPKIGDLQLICTYVADGCKVVSKVSEGTVVNTLCTPPIVPLSLTPTLPEICEAMPITLHLSDGERNSGQWALYADSCGGVKIDSITNENNIFVVYPQTTTTYYVRGEGCGTQTACVKTTLSVNPLPAEIKGDTLVCVGDTIRLSCATEGGRWITSTNVRMDATGLLTGITAGRALVTYIDPKWCPTARFITVNPLPSAIVGDTNLCEGSIRTYHSTPIGGIWKSTSPDAASVHSASGLVKALKAGTSTLVYTAPETGCRISQKVAVHQQPPHITGSRTVCEHDFTQLTNTALSGVWSLAPDAIASIDASGMVQGHTGGQAVVTYLLGRCSDTFHIRVNKAITSIEVVTGPICEGSYTTAMVDEDFAGGTWESSDTTIATVVAVSPTEARIDALKAGLFSLSYTAPSGCSRTRTNLQVSPIPAPISGDSILGVGLSTDLTSATPNGVWSSSNMSIATVDANGVVIGMATGTVIIRYTLVGANCYVEHAMRILNCASLELSSTSETNDQRVCFNTPIVDISHTLTDASTTTISWQKDGLAAPQPSGLTYDPETHTISGTPTSSGHFTYTIRSTDHHSACPTAMLVGQLTVYEEMFGGEIAPADASTICFGEIHTGIPNRKSGGGGSPAAKTYQWEISSDGINFTDMPGITTPGYNTSDRIPADRYYRRKTIGPICGIAFSNVVKITVYPRPAVPVIADVTENTACTGSPNGSITITPQADVTYSIDGTNFFSSNVFNGLSQGDYTVYVQNAEGCRNIASASILSSDAGLPNVRLSITPNDTLCSSEAGVATLEIIPDVINGGTSPTFLWSTGSTDDTLSVLVPASTTTYYVTVTNTGTGCFGSFSRTVTVMPKIEVVQPPVGDTGCVAQQTFFIAGVCNNSATHSHQWQSSPDNVTFTDIAGAIMASYTIRNDIPSNLYYRCYLTDYAGICPSISSVPVNIWVREVPTVVSVTTDSLCGRGSVELSAVSSDGSPIHWHTANGAFIDSSASGAVFTTPIINVTTTYFAEADNGVCESNMPLKAVTATIFPAHELNLMSGDLEQNRCLGSSINPIVFQIGGGAAGVDITWTGTADANTPPEGISVSSTTISGTPEVAGTYGFTITTTGNACTPVQYSGTIVVDNVPTAVTVSGTTSACVSTVLTASGGTGGTIFWQNRMSNGTDTVFPETSHNITTSGTYFFRARSSHGNCWGAQGSLTVAIHALPEPVTNIIQAEENCEITLTAVGGEGNESDTIFWTSSLSGTETAISGRILIATTTGTYYARLRSQSGCWGEGAASHVVVPEEIIPVGTNGCNSNEANWGCLGTVSFVGSDITISGNGTTQIWSGEVTSTACAKRTTLNGGYISNYNADCRSNPDYDGDWFTWCAVTRYGNQLCPAPWRVPTMQDFIDLDIAMGGTGLNRGNANAQTIWYTGTGVNQWGMQRTGLTKYAGICWDFGAISSQGSSAYYWSQSADASGTGIHLSLNPDGVINPTSALRNAVGLSLRCVRNQ